jgi:hypothetical protein
LQNTEQEFYAYSTHLALCKPTLSYCFVSFRL